MPLARLLTVATLVLGLTTAVTAQEVTFPAPDFGRYHALVIGINDYEHLPKLVTAVADAEAVAAARSPS